MVVPIRLSDQLAKERHSNESQVGAKIWRKREEKAARGSSSHDDSNDFEHNHLKNPVVKC